MVTKGIIKTIDFAGNTCTVRIPFFETANNDEIISTAPISNTPGSYNGYKVGDVVWVAFEDGSMDCPVVIGKLYLGVETEKADPRGTINVVDSKASNSAEIPFDTKLSSNIANNVAKTNVPFASLESISNALSTAEVNIAQNDRDYGNRFKQVISDIEGTNSTLEQTANRMVAQVSGYKQKTDKDGKPIYDENGQPELELDNGGNPIPENFGWKLQKNSWTVFDKDKDILKADKAGLIVRGKIIAETGHLGKFIIGAQHPCDIIGADASGIYSENYLDNQGNDITTFGQEPGTSSRGIYIGTDGLRLGDHFAVDTSGNVTATSLTISYKDDNGDPAATNIDEAVADILSISKGYSDSIRTDLGITTITPEGISTPVVIANDLWVNSGHINGTLTAHELNVPNKFLASVKDANVSIGGFKVGEKVLTSTSGNVGISSDTSTGALAFWAGGSTKDTAKFYVTNAGDFKATSGTIGGCTINNSGKLEIPAGHITGKLHADHIDVATLAVTDANFSGQLSASKIKVEDIQIKNANIAETLTVDKIDVANIKITNANISEKLEASKIKVEDIKITNANISEKLEASNINAAGLYVGNGNRSVRLDGGGYIYLNGSKVKHPTNGSYFVVPLIRFESFDTFQVERQKWLCAVMEFYTPGDVELSTSQQTRLVKLDVFTDYALFGS